MHEMLPEPSKRTGENMAIFSLAKANIMAYKADSLSYSGLKTSKIDAFSPFYDIDEGLFFSSKVFPSCNRRFCFVTSQKTRVV
jgi:hypothetical protein